MFLLQSTDNLVKTVIKKLQINMQWTLAVYLAVYQF